MGNSLCRCVSGEDERENGMDGGRELLLPGQFREVPRGPPPPYQEHVTPHMMNERAQLQLVQRMTLIHSLPWGKYESKDDKSHDKERECAICMMEFAPGEAVRFLPCMHYYHIQCVDDWLMRALTCPTCMERVDLAILTHQSMFMQPIAGSGYFPRNNSTSSLSSESSQSSHSSTPALQVRPTRLLVRRRRTTQQTQTQCS